MNAPFPGRHRVCRPLWFRVPVGALAAALAALLVLAGCGKESVTATPSGGSSELCSASGAQLLMDMTTPVAGYTWNDPHVLKSGADYWMYASATDSFVFPVVLFRLHSADGVTWALDPGTQTAAAPMLGAGGATGTWDDGGAETPAVVYFNSAYHLFYTTYATYPDDPAHSVFEFRIGHAVSADGVTGWAVDATPVVSPGAAGTFDSAVVGEPAPVVFNSKIYLYFTAVGPKASLGGVPLQVIGLTTYDGSTWSTPVSVLEPDQSIYPRSAGWYGYSTPNAIVHNAKVHLFMDVAYEDPVDGWMQVRLHHAVSADGETGWVTDRNPLLKRGSVPWTAREVRSPSPLDDGGTLRLYFAGDDVWGSGDFGIGVTSCPGLAW